MKSILYVDECAEVPESIWQKISENLRLASRIIYIPRVQVPEKPPRGKDANPEIYG